MSTRDIKNALGGVAPGPQAGSSSPIDASQDRRLAALEASSGPTALALKADLVAGKVPAGQLPDSSGSGGGSLQRGARSFLSDGVRLAGANITIKPSHERTDYGDFYAEWDWTGWIKPQIDCVIAEGGNTIGLCGDITDLNAGRYTQASYFAKWTQLVNYCADQNLFVYPKAAADAHVGGLSYTTQATRISEFTAFISKFPNVVACDLLIEISTFDPAKLAGLKLIREAAKPTAPHLPMTFSLTTFSSIGGLSRASPLDEITDYIDAHTYSSPSEDWASVISYYNRKPIMIGEFGVNAGQTDPPGFRTEFMRRIRNLMANHPQVMGCLYWALGDQGQNGDPNDNWGLYTNQRTTTTAELTLPAATIPVLRTGVGSDVFDAPAFPASGTIAIGNDSVSFTGKTATSFTGCSGGSGHHPAGTDVGVRRADVADIFQTFPQRTGPIVIERKLDADVTIGAQNADTWVEIAFPYFLSVPALVHMTAVVDIAIPADADADVYNASIRNTAGQSVSTFDGLADIEVSYVSGKGRHTMTVRQSVIVNPSKIGDGATYKLNVGHVSGSATTAVVKAGTTRGTWEINPL